MTASESLAAHVVKTPGGRLLTEMITQGMHLRLC